jgi:DNA-binding transcriptional regulator YiaG
MAKQQITKIEQKKIQLKKSQLEIVSSCLNRLVQQDYAFLPEEKMEMIAEGLEKIIAILEIINPLKTNEKSSLNPFDKSKAKDIRKKGYLTQVEITERLGLSQSLISRYENGSLLPNPYKLQSRKYLEFLKEQGYNPFGI